MDSEDWTTVKKKIKVKKPKTCTEQQVETIQQVQVSEQPVSRVYEPRVKKIDDTDIIPPKLFTYEMYSKIIAARNKLGWSRKELGMKANISEIKITNIENGVELYDSKLYVKLKNILNLK